MNSTKWREVWSAAAARRLRFSIDWVWEPEGARDALYAPVAAARLTRTGFRDPGPTGAGPCEFREIYRVRFSKGLGDVDGFRADLTRLGKLPVEETESHFELCGYQPLVHSRP